MIRETELPETARLLRTYNELIDEDDRDAESLAADMAVMRVTLAIRRLSPHKRGEVIIDLLALVETLEHEILDLQTAGMDPDPDPL